MVDAHAEDTSLSTVLRDRHERRSGDDRLGTLVIGADGYDDVPVSCPDNLCYPDRDRAAPRSLRVAGTYPRAASS